MLYAGEEDRARSNGRGIHRGAFVEPWNWRRGKRLEGEDTFAAIASGPLDVGVLADRMLRGDVYVGALALSGGVRLQTIALRQGVPASTLRRWRSWWLEAFPLTREWQPKRGGLAAPPGEPPLRWLLPVMRGRGLRARLLRSLVWLMPWTGSCAFGAGPAAPAESVSVMNGYGASSLPGRTAALLFRIEPVAEASPSIPPLPVSARCSESKFLDSRVETLDSLRVKRRCCEKGVEMLGLGFATGAGL